MILLIVMGDLEHWTFYVTEKHKHIETCVLCQHRDGKLTEGSSDCLEYILLNGKLKRAFNNWMGYTE